MTRNQYFCPQSKLALKTANDAYLQFFNALVAASKISDVSGQLVNDPVSDLLIEKQKNIAYRITHGIPQLLPLLAISLTGLNHGNSVD